jgi:hypothetical protein
MKRADNKQLYRWREISGVIAKRRPGCVASAWRGGEIARVPGIASCLGVRVFSHMRDSAANDIFSIVVAPKSSLGVTNCHKW